MATGKGVDYKKEVAEAQANLERRAFVMKTGVEIQPGQKIRLIERLGAQGGKYRFRAVLERLEDYWY